MSVLLHPTYFPSISHYVAIAQMNDVVFEMEDNYQKQTYRNRMYVYGANGKLSLNIPVKHTKKAGHQKYKEVKIENDFPWQKQHWKSLQTAYRTSPFFEFYEDDIAPIFKKQHRYLLDLNMESIETINDLLQLDTNITKTSRYELNSSSGVDARYLVNAKKEHTSLEPYTQVFGTKHGFLNDLSILDLLFNEGTNALTYLQAQHLHL
ncbi:WbqC family protein [Sungkyunkwania multivorans]|uniref:WbqC family protein n=1 Tax=Sungkyunkwania multivorans TaxID=1173618 RepID=A0ABW3CWY4_9FLAO